MQKLKKIVSKLSNDSIFHQIIQSKCPKQQQYVEAVQQFSHFTLQKQQHILRQIFDTFKKPRSTKTVLSALLLIDYLYSLQPEITLFNNCSQPKISKQHSIGKKNLLINEKIFAAQEQFIKFYFHFLKQVSKKTEKQIDFNRCELGQWIDYCEVSLNSVLQIIKIDFVLSFLSKNNSSQILFKMCFQSIFQKVSFDLKIINKFLQKHLRLVTKKHQQSFRINSIYEKLLFANKNFIKFNVIVKHLSKKITFQEYQVDKTLNKSIQLEMYEREDEKKDYLVTSSRKKIQEKQKQKKQSEDFSQRLTVEGDTMIRLNQFI